MAERPEDLNLPAAVVNRIIKDSLPDKVKVSKEATLAIAKAASVFVLYATSCSNNVAAKSHRKTIHGSDVISAMDEMEFTKFVKPLEMTLALWKKEQAKKKEEASKKKKEKASEGGSGSKTTSPAKTKDQEDKENNDEEPEEENKDMDTS